MADTYYWSGPSAGTLSNVSNWSSNGTTQETPAAAPGTADDLVFHILGLNDDRSITMAAANRSYASMTFRSTGITQINRGSSDSSSANTLTIGSGGLTVNSDSGVVTFGTTGDTAQKVNLRAAGSLSIANNSASLLTFNRGWSSGATSGTTVLTLNGSGSGGTSFVDAISNGTTGANLALYIDTADGVTTLQGSNTFTGGTTLNQGTLAIRNSNALGAGPLVINGGTIGSIVTARTISSSVGVTINNDFTLGGLASGAATTFNGSVNLTGENRTITLGNNATFGGEISNGGLTVEGGARTLTLAGNSTYNGATFVSSGTLLLSGALGNTTVTVEADATIAGNGSIAGSLHFDSGANLLFSPGNTLIVNGADVTFAGFGIENLIGLDSSIAEGIYPLIDGTATFNLANVSSVGVDHAYSLGGGRSAYFQPGSLELVVIPEPSVVLLAGFGLLALLRCRRP
jgi:autotransporter-associated beta strand protein